MKVSGLNLTHIGNSFKFVYCFKKKKEQKTNNLMLQDLYELKLCNSIVTFSYLNFYKILKYYYSYTNLKDTYIKKHSIIYQLNFYRY